MTSLEKPKVFIITYDDGIGTQTLQVPDNLFYKEEEFRKNIISMKCLSCNFESNFSQEIKS